MKVTALNLEHKNLGAKLTPFAGFEMPLFYEDISKEHLSVRHSCGIFDVSHMGEFFITGKDALTFVNKIVTNHITDQENKVTYALLLNDKGQVLDDLLVYVSNKEEIAIVCNASNIEKDYEWITSQVSFEQIEISNLSDIWSEVAIQGPNASSIVKSIFGEIPASLTFMTFAKIPYKDKGIIISRTGYTGEDGFEIYAFNEYIVDIWKQAISLGAKPCGLGSRDTLRFQANLPLYGHEIDLDIHPYTSGLKFAVKVEKDFIGKDALLTNTSFENKKLVGLELLERNIPRQGYKVFKDDIEIGYITTGYLLPEVDVPLAIALIDKDQSELGNIVEVEIRNKKILAKVRNRKFLNKNYVK